MERNLNKIDIKASPSKGKIVFKSPEQDVVLEYLTVGKDSPKTFLVSGVHGNEKTGQLVIQKLLATIPHFMGTLTVLSIANPTGFAKNIRQEPLSGLDLNRSFLDTEVQSPAKEIIADIVETVKQNEYVIDLHNFTTDGLIQVVSNHVGNADALALLFKPDVVRTSGKAGAPKRVGTFNQLSKTIGVSYVLLELPLDTKISEGHVDQIVSGLKEHLVLAGNYSQDSSAFNLLPKVGIRLIKAETAGTFIKSRNIVLGTNVSMGETLGEILVEGRSIPIAASCTGVICELDPDESRKVYTGQTLVGIGEHI